MPKKNAAKPTTTTATPAPVQTAPSARLGLGLVGGIAPMRRMDFQDALLEANREMRLTDAQLVLVMNCEHPTMLPLDITYIPGIRRLYNAGKHTKHQIRPASPVPEFDAAGNVVEAKRERKAKATAEPLTAEELGEVADAN